MTAKAYLILGTLLILITSLFAGFATVYSNGFNFELLRCFGGFWIIGLLLLVWGGIKFLTRQIIGPPEFVLSQEPLQLGDRFTLLYRHRFPNRLIVDKLTIRLLFRETAIDGSGTDAETFIHEEVIEEYQIPGGDLRAGQPISESYNMRIPADKMHTFNASRNWVQWIIRLDADIPNLPDFVEEREIAVLPNTSRTS